MQLYLSLQFLRHFDKSDIRYSGNSFDRIHFQLNSEHLIGLLERVLQNIETDNRTIVEINLVQIIFYYLKHNL